MELREWFEVETGWRSRLEDYVYDHDDPPKDTDIQTIKHTDVVVGVISANFSVEPEMLYTGQTDPVDLSREETKRTLLESGHTDEEADREMESNYFEDSPAYLFGDWTSANGLYHPYWTGPNMFSGVSSGPSNCYVQILRSRFAMDCHKCSPCYPGQGDLDTPGDYYVAYCPPPGYWSEEFVNQFFDRKRKLYIVEVPEYATTYKCPQCGSQYRFYSHEREETVIQVDDTGFLRETIGTKTGPIESYVKCLQCGYSRPASCDDSRIIILEED